MFSEPFCGSRLGCLKTAAGTVAARKEDKPLVWKLSFVSVSSVNSGLPASLILIRIEMAVSKIKARGYNGGVFIECTLV